MIALPRALIEELVDDLEGLIDAVELDGALWHERNPERAKEYPTDPFVDYAEEVRERRRKLEEMLRGDDPEA